MIDFKLSNIGKPAPLIYRRFVNVMIIFIVPATATLIISLPIHQMSNEVKIWVGSVATYLISVLKATEYFLGEDNKVEPPK